MELLTILDATAAMLAIYAYNKSGFWFYGMLSYVSLFIVAIYVSSYLTGNHHLYSDNVSIRWMAVDAGLIGYMANDLFWRGKKDG